MIGTMIASSSVGDYCNRVFKTGCVNGQPVQAAWDDFMRHLFTYLDVNHDGVLDRNEIERAPSLDQILTGGLGRAFGFPGMGGGMPGMPGGGGPQQPAEEGGPAADIKNSNTIGFYAPALALVVRGTSRVHTSAFGGLTSGKKAGPVAYSHNAGSLKRLRLLGAQARFATPKSNRGGVARGTGR